MCWAAHSKQDRKIMRYLGIFLLIFTFAYVRPVPGFGFLFCILTSTTILALSSYASQKINDFFLKIIGLNSSLQAVFHLPNYANPRSDATKFSELLGGTPFFLGYSLVDNSFSRIFLLFIYCYEIQSF